MSGAAEEALATLSPLGGGAAVTGLLADPSRARDISPEGAVALLVKLAALQVALAARLQVTPVAVAQAAENADADRHLTVEQAAEALNVPVSWFYNRSKVLPFARKFGGMLRFSERGLRAWASKQRP